MRETAFRDIEQATLAFARAKHPAPFRSIAEAVSVIDKERGELSTAIANADPVAVLAELASIAAMCRRAAEDLALTHPPIPL